MTIGATDRDIARTADIGAREAQTPSKDYKYMYLKNYL